MARSSKPLVAVSRVEYLGASGAKMKTGVGKKVVVLTLRLNPKESFEPDNLALTKEQAKRLIYDVTRLLESCPDLK